MFLHEHSNKDELHYMCLPICWKSMFRARARSKSPRPLGLLLTRPIRYSNWARYGYGQSQASVDLIIDPTAAGSTTSLLVRLE